MKKNMFLRVASVLLVLTLLSTCAISGTFAKYVAFDTASAGQARVAKWGVTIDVIAGTSDDTDAAFSMAYKDKAVGENDASATVKSNAKVVAPGTNGTLGSITLGGTPEVALKLDATIEFELGDNWTAGGAYYCPLQVTVGGTTGTTRTTYYGNTYDSADLFEVAIENAIAEELGFSDPANDAGVYTKDITTFPINLTDTVSITWEWAFTDDTAEHKQTDKNDSILGDAANATIDFKATVSATQLD